MMLKEKALTKYFMEHDQMDCREAINSAINNDDYEVLTDDEADEAAKDYILDNLWAFNKSFLNYHSEAIADMTDKEWEPIQNMYESANKIVFKLIDDIDYFIEDAINADGRGHFLSLYDGEENEVQIKGEWFYIYRNN